MCFFNVAPSIAPVDVSIDRTSPTVMVVSWTPLSYVEARGFISHYTVAYSSLKSDGRKRQALDTMFQTVPGVDSSTVTIGNLEPDTVYFVQVSATTGGGTSPLSLPVLAQVQEGNISLCVDHCISGLDVSGPVIGIIVVVVVAVVVVVTLILVIVKLKLNNK